MLISKRLSMTLLYAKRILLQIFHKQTNLHSQMMNNK